MTGRRVALESAADFTVPLRRSRWWLAVIAGCSLAFWVCWPDAAPLWWLIPLPGLLWCLWREAGDLEALEVRGGERLAVRQGGEWTDVELCDSSVALPGLIVLHYRQAGRRRHCVLLADSASSDALRRLRMFIRWRVHAPVFQGSR
ncbi:protein YgfX [Paludibacterium purpuratum]|uniref:Toxin CptA n=1 Tax=Paludibacterium purpuratum TaxID=1144873 RepID=A0A4R7B113_9NEIS|nr:protein YgfX [Paludibacterium purpuratum]TDR73013.1 hypothetical protein DFP86_11545 [Paludibacterium purpuratum]